MIRHRKKVIHFGRITARNILCMAILSILLAGGVFFLARGVLTSKILSWNGDRLQVVFYQEYSEMVSIDRRDLLHSRMQFNPDTRVLVPGGFGYYRVGSLGKLIRYQKDKTLFSKAFSSSTGSMISIVFYPRKETIYYSNDKEDLKKPLTKREMITSVFFNETDGSFIDRIILGYMLFGLPMENIERLEPSGIIREGKEYVSMDAVLHKSMGYWFQRAFRKEDKTVQIAYEHSYSTAQLVSIVIEGSGIRVVDLAEQKKRPTCEVWETGEKSKTAEQLVSYFSCVYVHKRPPISDILFVLGPVEEKWLIHSDTIQ